MTTSRISVVAIALSIAFTVALGATSTPRSGKDLEAHGFYWTASDNDPTSAPFYNFGKGSQALYRQAEGEKHMAASVRCVK
jgi:hypothetical protein